MTLHPNDTTPIHRTERLRLDRASGITAREAWAEWQHATDPADRDEWRELLAICVERCR